MLMSGFNDISNNGGPGSAAEPSMEEILASIRRILKEDESGRPPAKTDDRLEIDDDVLVLDASMVAKTADMDSATMLMPEPALEHELAGPHADDANAGYENEFHLASETTLDAGTLQPEPEPAPAYHAPPDELILPEPEPPVLPEPEPVTLAEPPSHQPPPEPETEPEDEPTTKMPAAAPAREPYMSEQIQPPEGLIGEAASDSAKNAIGSLVRSISAERAVAVSRVGVTIEDIVREEIRPMLKAWLDTHLPVLVERIVRAEIERVVDRTQL